MEWRRKKITVRINGDEDHNTFDLQAECCGGLAVHLSISPKGEILDTFSVTRIQSGYWLFRCADRKQALGACEAIVTLYDWTLSTDELIASAGGAIKISKVLRPYGVFPQWAALASIEEYSMQDRQKIVLSALLPKHYMTIKALCDKTHLRNTEALRTILYDLWGDELIESSKGKDMDHERVWRLPSDE